MSDVRVREATADDIDVVVNLLSSTFQEDPSVGWVVRKAADPEALLAEYFTIIIEELYLPHGRVTVAVDDETFLGAALWVPPEVKAPRVMNLRLLGTLTKAGKAIADVLKYKSGTDHSHFHFPHWYLHTIAVPPQARGRGVGTILLDEGIEYAADSAIVLEATSLRSARLYMSKGFVPLEEVPTIGPENEIAMCKPSPRLVNLIENS